MDVGGGRGGGGEVTCVWASVRVGGGGGGFGLQCFFTALSVPVKAECC